MLLLGHALPLAQFNQLYHQQMSNLASTTTPGLPPVIAVDMVNSCKLSSTRTTEDVKREALAMIQTDGLTVTFPIETKTQQQASTVSCGQSTSIDISAELGRILNTVATAHVSGENDNNKGSGSFASAQLREGTHYVSSSSLWAPPSPSAVNGNSLTKLQTSGATLQNGNTNTMLASLLNAAPSVDVRGYLAGILAQQQKSTTADSENSQMITQNQFVQRRGIFDGGLATMAGRFSSAAAIAGAQQHQQQQLLIQQQKQQLLALTPLGFPFSPVWKLTV